MRQPLSANRAHPILCKYTQKRANGKALLRLSTNTAMRLRFAAYVVEILLSYGYVAKFYNPEIHKC